MQSMTISLTANKQTKQNQVPNIVLSKPVVNVNYISGGSRLYMYIYSNVIVAYPPLQLPGAALTKNRDTDRLSGALYSDRVHKI